jgi:hypothetical protein
VIKPQRPESLMAHSEKQDVLRPKEENVGWNSPVSHG